MTNKIEYMPTKEKFPNIKKNLKIPNKETPKDKQHNINSAPSLFKLFYSSFESPSDEFIKMFAELTIKIIDDY